MHAYNLVSMNLDGSDCVVYFIAVMHKRHVAQLADIDNQLCPDQAQCSNNLPEACSSVPSVRHKIDYLRLQCGRVTVARCALGKAGLTESIVGSDVIERD